MPQPLKVFEIVDEKDLFSITFFRKYADGLENGIISMFVVAGLLITGIILASVLSSPSGAMILSVLMGILLLLVAVGIAMSLKSRNETQKLVLTKNEITLTKSHGKQRGTHVIQRKDFQFIQMDNPDKMGSALGMLILFAAPFLLIVLGMAEKDSSPALYTSKGSFKFFEFGTKAQKMWVMKSVGNFIERTR